MTRPSVSLCMIVRDEDRFLAQCIESVRSVVDEMIVVDTGSIDTTREVAAGLGATVVEFPWQDDFAAARNHGLALATCDWVLVLDADEAIDADQLPVMIEHLSESNSCFQLTQRHYSNDHRLSGYCPVKHQYPRWERSFRGFFESGLVRLFPNHRGIRYVGRIHELVEPSIETLPGLTIVKSPIILHHYGHTEEVREKKDKNRLYRPLGEAKSAEQPHDWKALFELGVECNRPGQHDESIAAFRSSLELNQNYLPTWINLGYVLCEVGRTAEAIECLTNALKRDPTSAEAHCNLGVAFLREQRPGPAEMHFREAIRLRPVYLNAYFNLARALAAQSRLSEAAMALMRLIEISPLNGPAFIDLGALYAVTNQIDTALPLVVRGLEIVPNHEDGLRLKAELTDRSVQSPHDATS